MRAILFARMCKQQPPSLTETLWMPLCRLEEPVQMSPSMAVSMRVDSLDLLRGIVMALMALDHTRDFFTNLTFDPETLSKTWLTLFLTRSATHFCAPLFFLLAGVGAYFFGSRRSSAELSRFLLSRGVWLIVIEFTVVGTAWTFKFPWGFFGVIFALGASMIVLSALVRLPIRWLAILSIATVLLHDATDTFRPTGACRWIWDILHVKGGVIIAGFHNYVLFPLVPWFAVMSLGYCFGPIFQSPDRRRWLAGLGTLLTLVFIILRSTNLYGNPPALPGGVSPGDFHIQPSVAKTIILFLDTEKYPPSLQFLLMTLGPSLLLLYLIDRFSIPRIAKPLAVLGRVPFFFYVLHLYVIHIMAILVAMALHQPYSWLLHGGFWFFDLPEGYGHDLPMVYALWLLTLFILYFPCRWFMHYKGTHQAPWLKYV